MESGVNGSKTAHVLAHTDTFPWYRFARSATVMLFPALLCLPRECADLWSHCVPMPTPLRANTLTVRRSTPL